MLGKECVEGGLVVVVVFACFGCREERNCPLTYIYVCLHMFLYMLGDG